MKTNLERNIFVDKHNEQQITSEMEERFNRIISELSFNDRAQAILG
ncbi:MAG: hypothetical protein PHV23_00935 [Candidatus Gracilibacteria bacterium]|nr:hypothetical protein [Candidatus Gracilibacteria bacterium]